MLSGYIGKDIALTYSQSSMAIAKFSLAVTTGFGDKKKTNWLNCVAFGKQAEALAKYMAKGSPIIIDDGYIQTGSYENKEGATVYTTDIIINSWEFAMKDRNSDREDKPKYPTEVSQNTSSPMMDKLEQMSEELEEITSDMEDSLPF